MKLFNLAPLLLSIAFATVSASRTESQLVGDLEFLQANFGSLVSDETGDVFLAGDSTWFDSMTFVALQDKCGGRISNPDEVPCAFLNDFPNSLLHHRFLSWNYCVNGFKLEGVTFLQRNGVAWKAPELVNITVPGDFTSFIRPKGIRSFQALKEMVSNKYDWVDPNTCSVFAGTDRVKVEESNLFDVMSNSPAMIYFDYE